MPKGLLKTNRKIRLTPKEELNYIAWFVGTLIVMLIGNELLAKDAADYLNGQGKIVYGFFIIFLARLFTFKLWGQYYRETINFLFHGIKKDQYVLSSLVNVTFDILILLCLFFWIKLDQIVFVRVPVAGLVYVLTAGISAVQKYKK